MHPAMRWRAFLRARSTTAALNILILIAAMLVAVASGSAPALAKEPIAGDERRHNRSFRVLVFTKAMAERHSSTAAGVAAIRQLGRSCASTST